MRVYILVIQSQFTITIYKGGAYLLAITCINGIQRRIRTMIAGMPEYISLTEI